MRDTLGYAGRRRGAPHGCSRFLPNGSTEPRACKDSCRFLPGRVVAGRHYAYNSCLWRASPHCMVVNLVRSGRKQPKLYFASAGGKARLPILRAIGRHFLFRRRKTRMKKILWGIAAWLALASAPAKAVDGMALELGQGDGTDMGRVAIQWDWEKRLYQGNGWNVGGYWDLGLGYWHNNGTPNRNNEITEIGLTPVLRLQRDNLEGFYGELGVGGHLQSHTTIGDKTMST